MKKIAVILAGGKGERFWPFTRVNRPKQVLPLATENPMIVDTVNRLPGFDALYIVANANLCHEFQKVLPPNIQYIIEPEPRNTAPAIGLACAEIMAKHGDSVVFFETADHYYARPDLYIAEVNKACEFAAQHDRILLIGIPPSEPHVGYGYIQFGTPIDNTIYTVEAFKEKPDRATAQNYLLAGTYLWNAGIYAAKCSQILKELRNHLPQLGHFLDRYAEYRQSNREEVSRLFHLSENTSIDYGVLERSKSTAVMKATMPWEDIGDFNSLKHLLQCDLNGNYFKKGAKQISSLDSNDNIVLTEKKIALIGVHDIAVVDTHDVIFICKRSDTAKIKKLLESVEPEYK